MLLFDLQRFADSDYVCLMHFDSSVTKDEIGILNWKTGGSPSIVNSNSFSGKSLYITTDNYLYATNVNLGSNDFTIDFWVTFSQTTVVQSYARIIELMSDGDVPRISLNCRMANSGACQAIILGQNGDGNNVNMGTIMLPSDSSTTLPTTRVHIAFVFKRSTQTGYIFSNGQLRKSGSVVFASYPVIFDKIAIGRCLFNNNNDVTGTNYQTQTPFYLDELCIIKTARWTSAFAVPTEPYALNNNLIIPAGSNTIASRSLYDSTWLYNAQVIRSGTLKYVDLSTEAAVPGDVRTIHGLAVRRIDNITRTQQDTIVTASNQTMTSRTLNFSVEFTGSTENYTYSTNNTTYVTVARTSAIKRGKTTLIVNFTATAIKKGSCNFTCGVSATNAFKAASKTITITNNYVPVPVIGASNISMGSEETTTTVISATNVSGYSALTYAFGSDNQITASYNNVSESWNIFGISVSKNDYSNNTASRTLKISAYFYGTATLTITATYSEGTVTKDITITSTYVPPFSSFSLSAQLNSKTLTWHKIRKIVNDGKSTSWTVGSRVSYNLTNSNSFSSWGWNISGVHFMYLGSNHDNTTNSADFAWGNNSNMKDGQVYPIANCGTQKWSQIVTGHLETGSSINQFMSLILNGSGNLKHVINDSPQKNMFMNSDDTDDGYDYSRTAFVLFDPGEIYASFDSMNTTSVYSGITFNGSFWTRRYYYYFNGGTNFVNDSGASKQIALMFRI